MANPITALTDRFTKKPDRVCPPALQALWTHLDTDAGVLKQIESISARTKQINADIKRADELQARIQAAGDAIAAAEADDNYHSRPVRDLSAERSRLADLENQLKPASEAARVAELVKLKLEADFEVLLKKRQELKGTTDNLIRAAALEEAQSLQGEYLAAREAMFAVAKKVFGALLAADTITKEKKQGVFVGSGLYSDLHIPLPPAFNPAPLGPEAAQRAKAADLALVGREAESLVQRLQHERG